MVYERLYLCVFALSTLLHDGITSNLYNTYITQVWRSKRDAYTCEQPLQCGGHCVELHYVYYREHVFDYAFVLYVVIL